MTRHVAAQPSCSFTSPHARCLRRTGGARVPAFPTACYSKDDPFLADLENVMNELQEAIYKQQETNAALKARIDAVPVGQQQSNLIAFMQKDPAAAQKFMQDMATLGSQAGPKAQALSEWHAYLKGLLRKEFGAVDWVEFYGRRMEGEAPDDEET